MNDYERLLADIDEALHLVDGLDSVDPDIAAKLDEARDKLQEAADMAEDRI